LLGASTWGVGVTATAITSERPNAANGAMPLLFNEDAFPGAVCDEDHEVCTEEVYQLPGVGNEDVPQDATQFNWTIFCTASGNPCNGDSAGVSDLIRGDGTEVDVALNDDIGPLNAGTHTTLFNDLAPYITAAFPVPIVNDAGEMVGFAYFRLTSIEGSPDKVIRGHFVAPYFGSRLKFTSGAGNATLITGSYVLELAD